MFCENSFIIFYFLETSNSLGDSSFLKCIKLVSIDHIFIIPMEIISINFMNICCIYKKK